MSCASLLFASAAVAQPARRRRASRSAQDRGDRDRRLVAEADAGNRRQLVLVFRARVPRVRDAALPDRFAEEERLRRRDGRFRHAVVVVGDVGQRRARHRARLGHRRHSEGVAGPGRRLSRAARRRGAGARRRAQLGPGREYRRGARRERAHAARTVAGHDRPVARSRRGIARREGLVRPRRPVRRRRRRAVHARRLAARDRVGAHRRHGPRVGRIHVRRNRGSQRRDAVARPQRARRRRAHEHRVEFPPRALEPDAALALRHRRRRRPAERRAAGRDRLVLRARGRGGRASGRTSTRSSESPKAPR